jgi:long-subunit fatty acid transport protein
MAKTLKAAGPDDVAPPPSGTGRQVPVDTDRVWLTLGRKYRVAEYESLSIDLGAASSVQPGEDLAAAHRRVFRELKGEFGDVLAVMRAEEGI